MHFPLISFGSIVIALGLASCSREWQATLAPQNPQDEPIEFAIAHGVLMRGSPSAFQGLSQPLQPKAGPNRAFEPCRAELEAAALRLGAVSFEAVSAGAERALEGGYEGFVEARVIYAGTLAYDVRHAVVRCRTNARGRILALE